MSIGEYQPNPIYPRHILEGSDCTDNILVAEALAQKWRLGLDRVWIYKMYAWDGIP